MNLYIIRHGIAEDLGANNSYDDSQRALTEAGRKKMRSIAEGLLALNGQIALLDGPIISILAAKPGAGAIKGAYDTNRLVDECSISTNTAAAGGNASLMSID